jgi:hypothetical protein
VIETSLERVVRLARPYQRQEHGRVQRVRGYAGRQAGRAMGALERAHLPEDVSLPTLAPQPRPEPSKPPWNPSDAFKKSLARIHPLGDKADDQLAADRRAAQAQSPGFKRDWISPVEWRKGQEIWAQRGEAAAEAGAEAGARADDSRWKAARNVARSAGTEVQKMHDDVLRLLARQVASHHEQAAQAIDRAADAHAAGRHQASIGHLDNAAFLLRIAGHSESADKVEKAKEFLTPAEQEQAFLRDVEGLGPSKGMTPLEAFEAEANRPTDAQMRTGRPSGRGQPSLGKPADKGSRMVGGVVIGPRIGKKDAKTFEDLFADAPGMRRHGRGHGKSLGKPADVPVVKKPAQVADADLRKALDKILLG